jgi:predicted CopG family antitoxin
MNLRRRLISVDENTYQNLKKLGQAGDSFNDVLRIILKGEGPNKDVKSSTS